MAGYRVYLTEGAPAEGTVSLPAPEAHHLVRVLRAREGDAVTLFDGKGRRWGSTLTSIVGKQAAVTILSAEALPTPRPLILSIALVKGKAFDEIVRHATEIGITTIQPLVTQRCEVKLDRGRVVSRLEHWRAIAIEACKQSGNLWLPEIAAPVDVKTLTAEATTGAHFVASLENSSVPLAEALSGLPPTAPLAIAIGPEGDFTAGEYSQLQAAGYTAVRLGAHVLRAETAALYALSVTDQLR